SNRVLMSPVFQAFIHPAAISSICSLSIILRQLLLLTYCGSIVIGLSPYPGSIDILKMSRTDVSKADNRIQ
ncbi:MAG: hypothetical protein M3N30_01450, partial [Bacteroidota bacterium]|nr:hypothetical protein [Bacteroidota bacterium]